MQSFPEQNQKTSGKADATAFVRSLLEAYEKKIVQEPDTQPLGNGLAVSNEKYHLLLNEIHHLRHDVEKIRLEMMLQSKTQEIALLKFRLSQDEEQGLRENAKTVHKPEPVKETAVSVNNAYVEPKAGDTQREERMVVMQQCIDDIVVNLKGVQDVERERDEEKKRGEILLAQLESISMQWDTQKDTYMDELKDLQKTIAMLKKEKDDISSQYENLKRFNAALDKEKKAFHKALEEIKKGERPIEDAQELKERERVIVDKYEDIINTMSREQEKLIQERDFYQKENQSLKRELTSVSKTAHNALSRIDEEVLKRIMIERKESASGEAYSHLRDIQALLQEIQGVLIKKHEKEQNGGSTEGKGKKKKNTQIDMLLEKCGVCIKKIDSVSQLRDHDTVGISMTTPR